VSGARNFASVAFAVAQRAIRASFTNPALILPSIIFPLFFFVAFAGGISGIENAPGFDFAPGYTAFVFVFVLLQSAAFGGVFTGFAIARDFEVGFARRLFLAARRREAVVAGYSMAALVRAAFTMSVVTTVALATGMQVGGNGVDLFGLYGLAVLVNVAATLWAAGVAMRLRTLQGGPAMQVPVFLALFLAPVYVPLDLLSGWVHTVATVNPATGLLNAGRDLMAGSSADIILAIAIALGLIFVMTAWALRSLRSAEAAGA
jgi:ABC-type multidrug transport system permease subunit